MTVNEVIKRIIPVLEGIKVPMTEIQAIGVPVSGVINDLKQCVVFMDQVEKELREKAEQEEKEKAAGKETQTVEDREPEKQKGGEPE